MTKRERQFVEKVWVYYRRHGRRSLPWRRTRDPYKILVSEVMLQQTQVDRVIPKYRSFLKAFPDVRALARASLGEVLREWQGLGYNRRAKNLHACAKMIVEKHNGKVPETHGELTALPGIGPYTAGAVIAFVYNKPAPIIETNIRTVYLHHFFKNKTDVSDKEIVQLTELTMDRSNPREWYWALMDYGACIKKEYGNLNRRSKHYTRQSIFRDSDRQIRGAILKLLASGPYTKEKIRDTLVFEDVRVDSQLEKLFAEGLLERRRRQYVLPA